MTENIEQVINAAESQVEEAAPPLEQTETETIEPAKTEPVEEPWPTKAQNAYEKQKKKAYELKVKNRVLESELQKYREQQATKTPQGAPKAEDFEDYGEYIEERTLYRLEQKQAETSKKQQETQTQAQQQEWITEKQEMLADNEKEMASRIPDYTALIENHSDEIGSLPEDVRMAALELDNPAAAFYALAKEGKLEWLTTLSPYRAVVELGKAEDRGIAMTKAKPVTQAPAPITGNRGTGKVGKSFESMDAKELYEHFNKT